MIVQCFYAASNRLDVPTTTKHMLAAILEGKVGGAHSRLQLGTHNDCGWRHRVKRLWLQGGSRLERHNSADANRPAYGHVEESCGGLGLKLHRQSYAHCHCSGSQHSLQYVTAP